MQGRAQREAGDKCGEADDGARGEADDEKDLNLHQVGCDRNVPRGERKGQAPLVHEANGLEKSVPISSTM